MKQLIILVAIGILPLGCTKSNGGATSLSSSIVGAAKSVAGMNGSSGVIITGDGESETQETGDETASDDQADTDDCSAFFSGKVNASLSAPLIMQASVSLSNIEGEVVVNADQLSLQHIRGPVLAMLQSSNQLDDLRGLVCLQGLSLNNTIGTAQLTNHRGYAEVENLNMTTISDNRGTLIVHGGTIGSIKNQRGSVRLIDVTVGDLDDVRGEIVLEGTSSVTGTVTNSDPIVQK